MHFSQHTFVINNTSNNSKTKFSHSSGASTSSLPPLDFLDSVLEQADFDWIHFDGQTTTNLYETMKHLRLGEGADASGIPLYENTLISISCFSRLKPDIEDCLPFADVVFFNKEFVNVGVCLSCDGLLTQTPRKADSTTLGRSCCSCRLECLTRPTCTASGTRGRRICFH